MAKKKRWGSIFTQFTNVGNSSWVIKQKPSVKPQRVEGIIFQEAQSIKPI